MKSYDRNFRIFLLSCSSGFLDVDDDSDDDAEGDEHGYILLYNTEGINSEKTDAITFVRQFQTSSHCSDFIYLHVSVASLVPSHTKNIPR